MVPLLATDDVGIAATLPFVAPALLLVGGLLAVVARDRLRGRRDS